MNIFKVPMPNILLKVIIFLPLCLINLKIMVWVKKHTHKPNTLATKISETVYNEGGSRGGKADQ